MFFGCSPCCGGDSDICRDWESVKTGAKYVTFEYSSRFVNRAGGGRPLTEGFEVSTSQTAFFPAGTNTYNFTLGQNNYRVQIQYPGNAAISELVLSGSGWNGLSGLRVLRLRQYACAPNVASFQTRAQGNFPSFFTNHYRIENFSSISNDQEVFATNSSNFAANDRGSSYSAESGFSNQGGNIASLPNESPGELSVSYYMLFHEYPFEDWNELYERFSVTEFYSADYGNLLIQTPIQDLQRDYLQYSSGARQPFP
jgi:hypothetical protein